MQQELCTSVPEGSICKACELFEYHVETLDRTPHIFSPIKLNEVYTRETALILVLPSPFIEMTESLAALRKIFLKNYTFFEEEQIYVIFGVACACKPGVNLGKTSIKKCSAHFRRLLELCIYSHKKAKIVSLGANAINALKSIGFTFSDIKSTSLSSNRLVVHMSNPYTVPTVCTIGFDRYTLGSAQERIIKNDLDFMCRMLNGGSYKKLSYETILSVDACEALREKISEKINALGTILMAVDTETTALNIFGRKKKVSLLTVQISFEEGVGYTIPIDHKEQRDEMLRIHCTKLVKDILASNKITKIMHNAMYDYRVFFRLGYRVSNLVWDTMLMHHLIQTDPPHGLKYLTKMYLDYGNYDDPLDKYIELHTEANPALGGNYGEIPLRVLSEYGAYDAAATFELYHLLVVYLEEENLLDLYNDQIYPAMLAFLKMSCLGIRIDYKELERYYVEYAAIMRDYYEKEIATLPQVIAMESKWPENLLYFEYKKNPEEYMRKYRKRTPPVRKRFNPKSSTQLSELLNKYCDIPVIEVTKKEAPSFSKDVRDQFKKFDPKNNPYGVDLTPIHIIDKFLLQAHEYSVYVKGIYESDIIDENSRIHATINLAGTATGRLSVSDPSLQNLPSRGEDLIPGFRIKSLFKPQSGKVIIQLDYSQAELRVIASVAEDEAMIAEFLSGADIHIKTASRLFGVPPEEVTPEQRKSAKAINFGIIYGLGEESLAVDFYTALSANESKAAEMYTTLVKDGYSGTWVNRR